MWILEANYGFGHGWEEEGGYDTMSEARADLKAYRLNAPKYSYRVKYKSKEAR